METRLKPGYYTRSMALALIAGVCISTSAIAQAFPSKPIRIIASTPPGGTIDLVARLLAQHLPAALGQPAVVENKPGAAGNIAAEFVAKAPADGHTLLVTASSHATNINLYSKLSYHPVKDFAPVSQLTSNSFVVAVPASSPANTLGDFLALARSKKTAPELRLLGIGPGQPSRHGIAQDDGWFRRRARALQRHRPRDIGAAGGADRCGGAVAARCLSSDEDRSAQDSGDHGQDHGRR